MFMTMSFVIGQSGNCLHDMQEESGKGVDGKNT